MKHAPIFSKALAVFTLVALVFAALPASPAKAANDALFPTSSNVLAEFEFSNNTQDSSGNNRHATFLGTGGATYTQTTCGTGLQIDATGEGLDWSTYAGLLTHPFTVEMILTPTQTTKWSKLFGFDDTNDDGWYYKNSGIQAYPNPVLGSTVFPYERHYIAFVSTSTTTMDVYFQGVLLGSTLLSFTAPPLQALFFKDDTDVVGEQLNGVVDALRISSVNRTPAEIAAVQARVVNCTDATPPAVVSTSLVASYTDTGPASFNVAFSEAVVDLAGNTDTEDVTNPANYLLVNKGVNGTADTSSCGPVPGVGGVKSDDTQVTVSGVTYNSATFTANVTLPGSLPVGSYRLFVCGTTSIVDASGNRNPLNGGSDYVFDFVVQAATSSTASQTSSLPATGFAPGRIINLPTQPAEKAYTQSDLWLEIPKLGLKMDIVGVPQVDGAWDVTWLGNQAGWLHGSAFPTWAGNTVLTGHVWDANNNPGVFANLKTLQYGDKILIHAWGQVYTYEVRESRRVSTGSVSSVMKHEKLDWVTLLTCEDYRFLWNTYSARRMVRAVLVSVK